METTEKRTVIYARYSCEKQTEQSIEGQLRVCHEFAERNGYIIVHEYIDRAVSGKTDKREQFQQMLKDSANKEFNYVLVYKLDRFARNRYDSAINKATLKKNGVLKTSNMPNYPTTDEQKEKSRAECDELRTRFETLRFGDPYSVLFEYTNTIQFISEFNKNCFSSS